MTTSGLLGLDVYNTKPVAPTPKRPAREVRIALIELGVVRGSSIAWAIVKASLMLLLLTAHREHATV